MVRGWRIVELGRVQNTYRNSRQVEAVPEGSISSTKMWGYIKGYLRSTSIQIV